MGVVALGLLLPLLVAGRAGAQLVDLDCARPGYDDRCESGGHASLATRVWAGVETGTALVRNPDGSASLIRPATGQARWTTSLDGFTLSDALVAANGFVYLVGGAGGQATVVAVDAVDGRTAWTAVRPGIATFHGVALSADGHLYVVGPDTVASYGAQGAPRWDRQVEDGPWGSATAAITTGPDGATVYVSGTTTVALRAADGAELWRQPPSAGLCEPYAAAVHMAATTSGVVLAARCPDGWAVVSRAADTGAAVWRHHESVGETGWYNYVQAVLVDPTRDRVYVAGSLFVAAGTLNDDRHDLSVVALDVSSGAKLWRSGYHASTYYDEPRAAMLDVANDRVVLVGISECGAPSLPDTCLTLPSDDAVSAATVAFAGGTGARQWAARVPLTEDRTWADVLAVDAVMDPDTGRVYTLAGSAQRVPRFVYYD